MNYSHRTRITDIVARTGLSRATVDRVINNRGGVSRSSTEKIDAALRELGFAPSRLDSLQKSKSIKIEAFLAKGTNPFFQEISSGLRKAVDLAADDFDFTFRSINPYNTDSIAEKLRTIHPDTQSVITMGVDFPPVQRAIDGLEARGVKVVLYVSDATMTQRSTYVGQDNFAAGRAAGRLMVDTADKPKGEFAVIIGHLQFRHLLDRRSGFEQFVTASKSDHPVVFAEPYGPDPDTARRVVNDLIKTYPNLAGFYLCGGGQPAVFEAIASSNVPAIAHEVTPLTRDALSSGALNFVISHDMEELGRNVLNAARCTTNCPSNVPCGINIYVPENLPQP